MKAKYDKMVDEYVKKRYGDLERGVLAPEVKYKVLFKIYRKKYKEKKIQVKMLRRLLKGKEEIESWAPSPDKVLPKEDGFNSLADGFKRYLRETCEECRYYKKGEDGEKDVCTKHDKFVTPTRTCFEWERKNCTFCRHSRMLTASDNMEAVRSCLWCDKKNEKRSALDIVCDEFE